MRGEIYQEKTTCAEEVQRQKKKRGIKKRRVIDKIALGFLLSLDCCWP